MARTSASVFGALMGLYLLAGSACFANEELPSITIEVRFIELGQEAGLEVPVVGEDDVATVGGLVGHADSQALGEMLLGMQALGRCDLLSAPKLTMRSGETGTVKVATEYRYVTDVDVRSVALTNRGDRETGVAFVPSKFETRDVGVMLKAAPVYDAARDVITMAIKAEVVTEPTWRNYTATYKAADGSEQNIDLSQPFFHSRMINSDITVRNKGTTVLGGMITGGKRLVEERVPYLGAIPWLGRLFRSTHEVNDTRRLYITVTASVVETGR